MITHGNLLHNLHLIGEAFEAGENSVGVFWLPFHHDMGLIGGVLETLACGGQSTFLSPAAFVYRPARWLRLISELRATISGGPNFAYDECACRVEEDELAALDLRSWEVAFCGAEPIRAATLGRFGDAFGPCGFRREAFYPCYGLAEATLLVTGGRKGAAPVVGHGAPEGAGTARVGCGTARGDLRVEIVSPKVGAPCAEGEVGEIWVAGQSVGQGYWGRPQESADTFGARLAGEDGPFLRTGDLGYLRGGELFLTGRLKDLIIIGGRNHYPQDVEQTVERCHPAVRGNGCAAFAVEDGGEERLVVLAEVGIQGRAAAAPGPYDSVARAIRRAVSEAHDVAPHRVVLVRPLTIPRTSSGKVRRHACRDGLLAGTLSVLYP
jgi:acyl-CoA synthetase (AMP-forming)/AMP-acid ligase II